MSADEVTTESLAGLVLSWRRSLRAQGKSEKTIQSYQEAAGQFLAWAPPGPITRGTIEGWLEALHDEGRAPSTVANRYRSLQQLWKWLVDEREIEVSPFDRMRPPKVPEKRVEVFTDRELRKLFDACSGANFRARRDTALLRVLVSTGVRVGGLAGMRLEDVDLDQETAVVTLKGGRDLALPLGPKAVLDLDRYLRVRAAHVHAGLPWLWIGERGRMRESGVAQMLTKLGARTGVADVHPHRFRHTYAHEWLAAGGSEGDLMELAGWRSREMLARYGRSAAAQRARDAHRRIAPGEGV